MSSSFIIAFSIGIILFVLLSILFIRSYFNSKSTKESYRVLAQNHHPLSFKGFWYRNRSEVYVFLGFVFLILAMGFLMIIFGII